MTSAWEVKRVKTQVLDSDYKASAVIILSAKSPNGRVQPGDVFERRLTRPEPSPLSDSQLALLRCFARGERMKEAAKTLNRSASAMRSRAQKIRDILNTTIAGAVAIGLREGWLWED
jgi:DNA-binding NarL/FixJ family response regulator